MADGSFLFFYETILAVRVRFRSYIYIIELSDDDHF